MTEPAILYDGTDVRIPFHMPLLDSHRFRLSPIRLLYCSYLPNTCTFVAVACPEQSICLFCQPNRNQRQRHSYGTHSNHSSHSCCPHIDKTNVTPSHCHGNGLRKVSHFHIVKLGDLCASKEKIIDQSCMVYTYFLNVHTCISPEYRMPGKQKESIICDLDLWDKMCCHRFTVSKLMNYNRFFFSSENPCIGHVFVDIRVTYI